MSVSLDSILGSANLSDIYSNYSVNSLQNISDSYSDVISNVSDEEGDTFDTILQSALGLVNQTNEYSNIAEEEELNYAMGLSEDTHTVMIAQQKANVSLMYTVAVRDAVIDAYNQIMNMQF